MALLVCTSDFGHSMAYVLGSGFKSADILKSKFCSFPN